MIRGRKPQVYNTSTKSTDSLLIPAASIDFADQKDLETKVTEIIDSISDIDTAQKNTDITVNNSLDIPKQIGTIIYNGEIQAPVWDINSSRIVISGETTGKYARTYTAKATILNGSWKSTEEEPLEAEQTITWTIVKKKIPRPSVNGIYIEDGTLQEVKLCDFNPDYCSVTGSSSARSAGEYGISINIINPNVVWEDNESSESFPLTWKMISRSSDITGAETSIAGLTSELSKLKKTVTSMQEIVSANSISIENMLTGHGGATCSCAPIISSLRRRIDLLETFLSLDTDNVDINALILLLTKQVEALETGASDMSYEVLKEEVDSTISAINKALALATDPSDITSLNDLKARVLNVYSINVAGEQIKDFRNEVRDKKRDILDTIEDGDTDEAKRKLDELKQDFKDIKDNMDDDTKEKVKALLDDIEDTIEELEKEIVRKEIQKILSTVDKNITDIKNKMADDEDPTSLIEETEDLLDDADNLIGSRSLPFEKDKILTYEDTLNDLKGQQSVKNKINTLTEALKDIKNNMNTYTDAQIEMKISDAVAKLIQIEEEAARFDASMFSKDIGQLEEDVDEVKNLFWKKQQEKALADITTRLNEIQTEIIEADPDTDDMTQWNNELSDIEEQIKTIELVTTEKNVELSNLDNTKNLLTDIKNLIIDSSMARTIAAIDDELNTLSDKIVEGLITYEAATEQLDDIDRRISDLRNDNNTESVNESITMLRAKFINVRQLNEDMKVYLTVKPMLRAVKDKIYDEDLDILWAELNAAKEQIPTIGTSSWIRELKNDATEIENILNSFSKNNTVENLLSHLDAALKIIVTVSDFKPTGITYDEIKTDLQNLEKASITMDEYEQLDFPTWYSLPDEEKAYLLENGIRKIRRSVVTTEEVFA